MMKTVYNTIQNFFPSIKSLGKILLLSGRATISKVRPEASSKIIIMANGPSLKSDIENHLDILSTGPAMAVNFAANAPEFTQLKPLYYILIDPYFFQSSDNESLVNLWKNISAVDWSMTLIVPVNNKSKLPDSVLQNTNISLATINPVGVEGWKWLENWAYRKALGMPRPRNVLIAAIMAAIQMGYKEIEIVGADHSWMQSIWVDDENNVISVQPHFYKEHKKEQKRVDDAYRGHPLHEIVFSFYVAFHSYHLIQRFAAHYGIKIYNCTPSSFIDAFPRRPLAKN